MRGMRARVEKETTSKNSVAVARTLGARTVWGGGGGKAD